MHPDLEKLLDLQSKDLTLLDADLRLKAVADDLARLDAALDEAGAAVEAARQRLGQGTAKREEAEKQIEAQRALQESRRSRIEQVKTAREVQALMLEVEQARAVLARRESDWLKCADLVQQQEQAVREAEERLAALQQDQGGDRSRLEENLRGAEAECELARQIREESAAAVERSLRQRYDRLWKARGTTVVVALRGDACGACYTAVPRNRRSQIQAGTHIEGCEACGVILYYRNGGE